MLVAFTAAGPTAYLVVGPDCVDTAFMAVGPTAYRVGGPVSGPLGESCSGAQAHAAPVMRMTTAVGNEFFMARLP